MDLANMHSWGLEIVRSAQLYRSPALDQCFLAFTNLGSEGFYVMALPILWWNMGTQLGLRIGIALLISVWSNQAIKGWLEHPRPYQLDPLLEITRESDYGAPSGHAQQSIVFWGLLAIYTTKKSLWVIGFLMVALLGFSRVYLGVHFPTDVFLGWFLGILIILGMVYLAPWVAQVAGPKSLHLLAIAVFVVTLWFALFVKQAPLVSFGAATAGLVLGEAWNHPKRLVRLSSIWQRLLINLVGLTGLLLLYVGLKYLFPIKDDPMYLAGIFVRYFSCGFWVSFLVPKMFRLTVS